MVGPRKLLPAVRLKRSVAELGRIVSIGWVQSFSFRRIGVLETRQRRLPFRSAASNSLPVPPRRRGRVVDMTLTLSRFSLKAFPSRKTQLSTSSYLQ